MPDPRQRGLVDTSVLIGLTASETDRLPSAFEPLPFDAGAARAYGEMHAAIHKSGRKARGRRAVDLLIAATARSRELPLYTRNPVDFAGLDHLIEVVSL